MKIKATSIRGGQGQGLVTEESALDAYSITIQGIMINETANDYPETLVRQLKEILHEPGVKYLSCFRGEVWGVNAITIHKWNIPQFNSTRLRYQPYTLQCRPDYDFEDFKRIMNEAQQ